MISLKSEVSNDINYAKIYFSFTSNNYSLMGIEDIKPEGEFGQDDSGSKEMESLENKAERLVSEASSFTKLYDVFRQICPITSKTTGEEISFKKFVRNISEVKINLQPIEVIPRIFGIRTKVQELLTKETGT